MKRLLTAVLLLIPFTFVLAQEPPRTQETINVTVRNVDLVVTDAKGNRVTGLTKDDLQLFENGTLREITNFSEVKKGATATTAQPAPRYIVIVFDVNTLTLAAKRQAVDAARRFLTANLRPGDQTTVYIGGNTLTKVSDWTGDAAAVGVALDRVNAEAASPVASQRQVAEKRIRDSVADAKFVEDAMAAGGASKGGLVTSDPTLASSTSNPNQRQSGQSLGSFSDISAQVRQFAQTEYRDVEHSISMMNAVMGAFGNAAGRKALIVAGGGLPTRPGSDLFSYLQTVADRAERGEFGKAMKQNSARNSGVEAAKFDTTPLIRAFADTAKAKGVTVYPLDSELGGLPASKMDRADRSDTSADFMGTATRVDGYQMLANMTGGVALLGGSAETSMAEIAKDLDAYYSIGYRTDPSAGANPQIDVKSKSGYRVRASLAPLPPSRDSDMQDRVVANNLEKQPNDLGITVVADPPVAGEGDRRTVSLKVMIPVKKLKLVKEGDSVTGGFNVYVATGDGLGNSSDVSKQTHAIKWPAEALPGLMEKQITYKVTVTMEPGRSQISIGVMDQRSEQRGFERVGL